MMIMNVSIRVWCLFMNERICRCLSDVYFYFHFFLSFSYRFFMLLINVWCRKCWKMYARCLFVTVLVTKCINPRPGFGQGTEQFEFCRVPKLPIVYMCVYVCDLWWCYMVCCAWFQLYGLGLWQFLDATFNGRLCLRLCQQWRLGFGNSNGLDWGLGYGLELLRLILQSFGKYKTRSIF